MAWSNTTATTKSWSATSATSIVWQQTKPIADSGGGVDFVLRVDEQHPFVISETRPAYLIEPGDTGAP